MQTNKHKLKTPNQIRNFLLLNIILLRAYDTEQLVHRAWPCDRQQQTAGRPRSGAMTVRFVLGFFMSGLSDRLKEDGTLSVCFSLSVLPVFCLSVLLSLGFCLFVFCLLSLSFGFLSFSASTITTLRVDHDNLTTRSPGARKPVVIDHNARGARSGAIDVRFVFPFFFMPG